MWPWFMALGICVVVLGFLLVVAMSGGHAEQGRASIASLTPSPSKPSPPPQVAVAPPVVLPPLDPADTGKLIQAMRVEAVKVERPAPTPLDVATADIGGPASTDTGGSPVTRASLTAHDVAPGIASDDAAPPALPIQQSLLSPWLTAEAVTPSKRLPVRSAWDAAASGSPEQVAAIDKAGALVEQGNVPMARDVLRPIAGSGNAVATYALAQSYDPAMLQLWQDSSAVPDVKQARTYYRQAQLAGVTAAGAKLAALH